MEGGGALRVALCDDEEAQLALLAERIRAWGEGAGCPCAVDPFPSGEALLFRLAEGRPYDLLLLDVEMGGMDGMTLARRIREADQEVPIAFLTNHPGYVFQGYEVSALRYLLKPVKGRELDALLEHVRAGRVREPACLVLPLEGGQRRVPRRDVRYLEAQGHRVWVDTAEGRLEVKASLASLAEGLGADFAAPHRSYRVNLRYVERVTRTECLLEDGTRLPVSRGAWEKLNRAFIAYYRGGEGEA